MEISSLDPKLQELVQAAIDVKQNAYCPYSNFRVGASVLCSDGSIYAGCNVENACYGLCVCAERNAIMKAVSEGKKNFTAAAVSCDIKGDFKGPCGVCRQVLAEVLVFRFLNPHDIEASNNNFIVNGGYFEKKHYSTRNRTQKFNLDIDLYLTKPDMTYKKVVLRDLLPMAFTPQSLEQERV